MQNCQICSNEIKSSFYCFHQHSFVDEKYRRGLSPARPLDICERCFYITPESPYHEFDKVPLSESLIPLRGEKTKAELSYEEVIGNRVIRALKRALENDIKKIKSVLDLRALTGGALEALKEQGIGESYRGFDFFSKNIEWSKTYRDLELTQWGEEFEKMNRGLNADVSKADLVFSSRPILELCSAPGVFLEAVKKILSPEGLCIFGERDLSHYPETIFLNELFTPWGNSFFTNENLRYLFQKCGFEVIKEQREGSIIYYAARAKDLPKPDTQSFQSNPYQKFPRFEGVNIEKYWQGKMGLFNASLSMLLTIAAEKSGSYFDIRFKELMGFGREPKKRVKYSSVQQKYLDVIVISCGRQKQLERTLKTFQKLVTSDNRKFRFLIHDDIMPGKEKESKECRRFIEESNIFSKKFFAQENKGIGESIKALLKEVETEYYFHLEDDFYFLRNIYLDPLIDIFDKHKEVNHIRFNKNTTMPRFHTLTKALGDVRSRQYIFNGQILTLIPFWSHSTNMSRMDSPFVRLVLSLSGRFRERPCNISLLKDCTTHEDVYEKMGTFIYGPLNQARIVYTSHGESMRDHMLKYFPDDPNSTVDDFKKEERIKINR